MPVLKEPPDTIPMGPSAKRMLKKKPVSPIAIAISKSMNHRKIVFSIGGSFFILV
jgi:hypothetical protein